MQTYAIGDIHGCYQSLLALEEMVPFQAGDRIITLGDYVDRGPDSKQVLEWLIERKQTYQLVCLRGNHELMMLDARWNSESMNDWLSVGGDETLQSYSRRAHVVSLADIPQRHWQFLEEELLPYYETESHLFVHACVYPGLPLEEQPDSMLYWEPFNAPVPHESGKSMICGHTSQRSGMPLNVGHAICIDTWAYGNGWLTCLNLQSGRFWQTNQRGQARKGHL